MTEAILEQLVRPLVDWNFGEQDDYGAFDVKATSLDTEEKLDAMLAEDVREAEREEAQEDQNADAPEEMEVKLDA